MISVHDLTFTYPRSDTETLHGLSFEIAEGEIFGFLGPSGAGKTTTQNILIGLLREYGGSARVKDREVSDWGQDFYEQIGVSFELPNHYLKLTALENLNHFRALYRGETLDPIEVLHWVGLREEADKRVSDYSKGMKVRLNLARSLLHRPPILFLDEPTNGLDPVNARKIKNLILELRKGGTTVFVTTHDMAVADELCDRVAFITAGDISLIDAPGALKKQFGKRIVRVEYMNSTQDILHQDFPLDGLIEDADFVALMKSAGRIETIHSQETTLDNIFIEVTGEELDL